MITIGRIATKLRKIGMEFQGVYQNEKAKREILSKCSGENLYTDDKELPTDIWDKNQNVICIRWSPLVGSQQNYAK